MTTEYSPGLEGIVAGETAISTVETGLTYRGYAIEDLAANSTYEEVAYLILHGELPTASQAAAFRQRLGEAAFVPQEIIETIRHIPASAPSMDVLRSAASLSLTGSRRRLTARTRRTSVRPSGCSPRFR
jgi:2-methylcitrate synthase